MMQATTETANLQKRIKELENEIANNKNDMEKFLRFFIANVSHEIRTPLNAILGFTNLLTTERQFSVQRKKDFVKMINSSSDRLINIVDSLLELSLIQNNQLKLYPGFCNIRKLLSQLQHDYNYKKYIVNKREIAILLSCNLEKQDEIISCDDMRLKQLFDYLLENALKFTNKGVIEIGCSKTAESYHFFVKDTGVGIPKDTTNIFDSFVKLNETDLAGTCGIGIGLTICKGIVEAMNGRIRYESNNEPGSTFYVDIPFHNEVYQKSNLKNHSNNNYCAIC